MQIIACSRLEHIFVTVKDLPVFFFFGPSLYPPPAHNENLATGIHMQ